ncbi:MAG: patatin-like phospholipase family protein [Bacteroidetes bacterium]|nr:patatin-like phospholipase family protein [Bacteroidota bacterium]MBU1372396.1 patatin-like phospholipase family protein [Bacteroidota bacterium]MBU1483420.1 patatin-like phospholipase family protein [Bacteroidota bacterium]MBU1761871.1 patatin-like phospholipase family protein [Bacteroidota bacterium]MBU2267335.1 patatin-like phospholipase family protein [Bacteroidota bacterium]
MKIGIVLSGGGIRGIAHLGVLKALREKAVKIDMISGTSAGAIVGALFANGIEPYEALQIFQETKLLKFIKPAFRKPAFLNFESAESLFRNYIPHNSFDKLEIPLTITATDFMEGKLVYFNKGEVIRKVLASSCIPGIFSPIEIDGKFYVDGGVLNNFPVEPLIGECDFIIGSSCNHLPVVTQFRNVKHVIERAAILSINHDMVEKRKLIDVLIEPKGLGETSIFDVKKAEEIFWLAHEETLNQISSIKKAIEKVENIKASN